MPVTLLQGDCTALLPTLPAGSVDAVVTDPPYGLSFMGHGWDHGVPGPAAADPRGRPVLNHRPRGETVMRGLIAFALVTMTAAMTAADDKSDRERKVKVALALSASPPVGEPQCCREDAARAWDDALRERKPIALFVGGECDGAGKVACDAGAVAVKVDEYAGSKERRIVVGSPRADGSGFDPVKTLPAKARPDDVAAAVKAASPKKAAPPKVSWYID